MQESSVKVQVEEVGSTERTLKISVDAAEVGLALQEALQSTQKKANLKGFRKGKAPLAMVKQAYGQEIHREALYALLDSSYEHALNQVKLRIVSRPAIDEVDFEEGKPFSYIAKVEILPEVKLTKYKGLEMTKIREVVEPARLDEELARLRESRAELGPMLMERPIQDGDYVIVDCQGKVDGEIVKELSGENLPLEMGKNLAFPGFEEKMLGAAIGQERDFDLDYPAGEEHALAGKTVHFHVLVREMKVKTLPELNDDFARDLDGFKTLAELKERIQTNLLTHLRDHAKQHEYGELMDQLVAANLFDVPNSVVEEELSRMLEELKKNLQQQKINIGESDEAWQQLRGDYRPQAEKRVRSGILLDAVGRTEELKVEEGDVERYLQNLAEKMGRPAEEVQRYYRDPRALESLHLKLLEEKTLEFLRDNAKIIKEINDSDLHKGQE